MAFVHLHTHSEYSLLDGANRLSELVTHVKRLGMDSLAITDHGNMHAAWSFYEEARAQQIRPILGFEAYLAFGPRQAREKLPTAPAIYSHLVLLARNRAGYRNLVRLTSIGYTEGFYRRPRIDREVLARYSEGITCLAACLSGEVAIHLRQGRYDEAKRSAEWFAATFGREHFWLEIQKHGIPEEELPEIRLRTVPCLRLLRFRFPINDYYTSLRRDEDALPAPPSAPEDSFLVVTRRDFVVRRHVVSRVQYEILSELQCGGSIRNAIARGVASCDLDDEMLARCLREWFAAWAQWKLFHGLARPSSEA